MSPDARKDSRREGVPLVARRALLFGAGARAIDALAEVGSRALEAAEAISPARDEPAEATPHAPKLPARPGHDPCLGPGLEPIDGEDT